MTDGKVVDIKHKQKEREANWWKAHDQMEVKLLAGNEDLQLLQDMTRIADEMHEENEAMYSALLELVTLKDMKDSRPQQTEYLSRKPLAWEAARRALGMREQRTNKSDATE